MLAKLGLNKILAIGGVILIVAFLYMILPRNHHNTYVASSYKYVPIEQLLQQPPKKPRSLFFTNALLSPQPSMLKTRTKPVLEKSSPPNFANPTPTPQPREISSNYMPASPQPTAVPTLQPTNTPTPQPTISSAPATQTWEGAASYYSRAGCVGCSSNFTMANGQPLNDYAHTVAFNWLPMGSTVRITNLSNGSQVIATVTDTGGFNALGRIIDLTIGTRDAIACSSLCQVKVEAI